jgi:hypothetical protein
VDRKNAAAAVSSSAATASGVRHRARPVVTGARQPEGERGEEDGGAPAVRVRVRVRVWVPNDRTHP